MVIKRFMSFIDLPSDHTEFLKAELRRRKHRSASYSLRAFARDLAMSPSTLSELINGKVGLSKERANEIAKKINLGSDQREYFCDLVEAKYSRAAIDKQDAIVRIRNRKKSLSSQLSLDLFQMISEWYHMAFLEMIDLKPEGQGLSAEELAIRFNLSEAISCQALSRLERMGLVKFENGKYVAVTSKTSVGGEEIPSQAVRNFHHQMIDKAKVAIEAQDLKERELVSTVFSVKRKDISKLKERLNQMQDALVKEFHDKSGKDCVYALSSQLFRLDTGDV